MSHRQLAPDATLSNPTYPHTKESLQLLSPGEIAEVDIELRPYGIVFEQGETLTVEITGYSAVLELPWLPKMKTINKGDIKLHTGGEYPSCLTVPVIP